MTPDQGKHLDVLNERARASYRTVMRLRIQLQDAQLAFDAAVDRRDGYSRTLTRMPAAFPVSAVTAD